MEVNKTILVVEDEPTMRQVLQDKLNREGFEVLAARDGREGLTQALAHHPDIILLDILMPSMTGIDMLRELRKDAWGKKVLVMVLTNYGEHLAAAQELGVIDFQIKSNTSLEHAIKLVKKHLMQSE